MIAGKILARILLNRTVEHIAEPSLSEFQTGFSANQGTVDYLYSPSTTGKMNHHLYAVFFGLINKYLCYAIYAITALNIFPVFPVHSFNTIVEVYHLPSNVIVGLKNIGRKTSCAWSSHSRYALVSCVTFKIATHLYTKCYKIRGSCQPLYRCQVSRICKETPVFKPKILPPVLRLKSSIFLLFNIKNLLTYF